MRRTVEITDLIAEVNRINAESTCHPEGRKALNSFLTNLLIKSDVYDGFGYLDASQVPSGQLPGIIHDRAKGNHEFPDDTRRMYYTSYKLKSTDGTKPLRRKFRTKS